MNAICPFLKPIREPINPAELVPDTEIFLVRKPDVPPKGTLVDIYTHPVKKNVSLFSAPCTGLLNEVTLARHCIHYLYPC